VDYRPHSLDGSGAGDPLLTRQPTCDSMLMQKSNAGKSQTSFHISTFDIILFDSFVGHGLAEPIKILSAALPG
jgi:hypothetical protein